MSKTIDGFKLSQDGVIRKFDGASIPNSSDNRDWIEYLGWVAEGNTPDPEYTAEELTIKETIEEIESLKGDLKGAIVWQFRMILELWKVLKQHTPAQNSDIDPSVLAKAAEWTTKVNRLQVIDE